MEPLCFSASFSHHSTHDVYYCIIWMVFFTKFVSFNLLQLPYPENLLLYIGTLVLVSGFVQLVKTSVMYVVEGLLVKKKG